jgi:hypothetical protein
VARGPTRTVGATVVLIDGALAAWIARGGGQLLVWLPEDEPARSRTGHALAERLAELAREASFGGLLVADVNGAPAAEHPLAPFLTGAGFAATAMGFQIRERSVQADARESRALFQIAEKAEIAPRPARGVLSPSKDAETLKRRDR